MHSAEHILTAVMMKLFNCGRPVTTHLETKKSKADYCYERPLSEDEAVEVEKRVNEIIRSNLIVTEEFMPRDVASRHYCLKRVPEHAGNRIRIVRIGDVDSCPCIGPHVASTGGIGAFRLVSTSWEEGVLRVRFRLVESSFTALSDETLK